jgi:nitroreductase / dihydropteridine reductase
MKELEALKWRASVRKFNTDLKVSDKDLETLLEAGNLAATSGGLQPFKIVVVSNDELKTQLVPMSYNQEQVSTASHVLIFATETKIGTNTVDAYINRAAEVRQVEHTELEGYKNSMNGYMQMMDEKQQQAWARNQAYISLGTVMTIAADLKIDSCAMEGFEPLKYQELLNLESENLMPVVILPIGYRSDEEVMANAPKVRKAKENFVLEIN